MELLIVHPGSKKELAALKALDISFEATKSPYDSDFVAKIEKSREQAKRG